MPRATTSRGASSAAGVEGLHEAITDCVAQDGAIAAHGFRDEERARQGERGGVELVKLDVGDFGTSAKGDRHAVPGGDAGVGGVEEQLTRAAACEDDGFGQQGGAFARGREDFEAANCAILRQQIAGEGVFEHTDRRLAHRADQSGFNGEPGCVAAGVEDARTRMCGFEPARKLSIAPVELDPERNQVADARGPFGAENLDRGPIAKAGAGAQGVGDMVGDAVVVEHDRGDAALGVAGVRFSQLALGDERDVKATAELKRGNKPCDAAAYNDGALHRATPVTA